MPDNKRTITMLATRYKRDHDAAMQTYGLDRFFSSLYDKSLFGLSFFTLSLVSIQQRKSFPIRIEQVIKTEVEKLKKIVENAAQSVKKSRMPS